MKAKLTEVYSGINHQHLIKVYRTGPSRLREALSGLTESEMKLYVIPGKWNILEIAIHLAQSEIFGAARIRQTITGSDKTFAAYDQDLWTRQLITDAGCNLEDLEEHLKLFEALRVTTVKIFENAGEEDWLKTGHHPARGVMTLRHLLELYADHSERHIDQILERRLLIGKAKDIVAVLPTRLY